MNKDTLRKWDARRKAIEDRLLADLQAKINAGHVSVMYPSASEIKAWKEHGLKKFRIELGEI